MSMDRLQYQNLKIKHNRYKNPNSYQHPWLSKITAYFCHCQQRKQMYSFIKTWQLTYRLAWSKTTMNTSSTPIQQDWCGRHFPLMGCLHLWVPPPIPRTTSGRNNLQLPRAKVAKTKISHPRISSPRAGHAMQPYLTWSKQWINL